MLFDGIKYAISPTIPAQRKTELCKLLDANGAAMTEFSEATHIVSNTLQFEGHEVTREDVRITTDEWVDRSIVHGKPQETKYYSADPNMIFSGVIACATDLEACDKEVIAAGINALGGLFREGYTRDCTHLLAARPDSEKYLTAMHYAPQTHVKVVLPHWFDDCFKVLARLPEEPYAWPDPPLFRSNFALSKARLELPEKNYVKAAVLEEEPADKIAAHTRAESDIWSGKRILLSPTLQLADGRRETVEASVKRAGGLIVQSSNDEAADVASADVYITQFRTGLAFVKAIRSKKTVGTLSWLFNVHKSGVITSPQEQLVHFPTHLVPLPEFDKQTITASNYEGDARRYLKKLIELMGGTFTPQMTAQNTAVVAAYIKGEKTLKAREWNIPVVNHLWLEDCFSSWTLVTPAQEKYVSFPPGVNFGGLVRSRSVSLPTEEELDEIERASEETEQRKDDFDEPTRKDIDNCVERRAGDRAEPRRMQKSVSPTKRVWDGVENRVRVSLSPSKSGGALLTRRAEEEEEEEEEEEKSPVRGGKGRPSKRRVVIDMESDNETQPRPGEPRDDVSPVKRLTKSRIRRDAESEDEVTKRIPSRPASNSKFGKSSPIKPSVHAESEDEPQQPIRPTEFGKGRSTKKPSPKVAVNSSRSKAAQIEAKSAMMLLNDDEFDSSSDDGLSPIKPMEAAPRLQSKRGKQPNSRDIVAEEEEEEEEEEELVLKKSTKGILAQSRKVQNVQSGSSKSRPTASAPQNQKMPLRKQASLPGPTPGRSVVVEIATPTKSSSQLSRTAASAEGTPSHASSRRNRRDRPRTPSDHDRENESPFSPSGSPVESPSRSSRFTGEAIRRSSQPTPIINLQRTPSKRQAATKASVKLHENALDINKFEKEKRSNRVRGAWEDGTEKSKSKLKPEPKGEESRKRRASEVQDETGMEDQLRKKKRKSDGGESSKKAVDALKKTKKPPPSASTSDDEEVGRQDFEDTDDVDASDIRLMTTQVTLSDHVLKGLRQLGVKMASKPTECNLLLANNIGRTEKFLCAIATARSIVTEDWATDSVKAKRILPPDNYLLKDPEGEKRHKFRLVDALRRAQSSERKLLEGHTFYFTKGLHRSEKLATYKNVIHSAGGKVVLANPTVRILKGHSDRHVISVEDDRPITGPLMDEGFHVYVPEFILMGILTQRMDWDGTPHRLDDN